MKRLTLYLTTFLIFIAIDLVWLGTMIPRFYIPYLGDLVRENPEWISALIFYTGYPIVLAELVLKDARSRGEALYKGALFGLLGYGTYELTNMALLKGWSVEVVVVDMIWGTLLTGVTALLVYRVLLEKKKK